MLALPWHFAAIGKAGQFQRKAGTLAGSAFNRQRAAHGFGQAARDIEAKARSAIAAAAKAFKLAEHAALLRLVKPLALIGHDNAGAGSFLFHPQPHL